MYVKGRLICCAYMRACYVTKGGLCVKDNMMPMLSQFAVCFMYQNLTKQKLLSKVVAKIAWPLLDVISMECRRLDGVRWMTHMGELGASAHKHCLYNKGNTCVLVYT